ncbi:MAG: hypothetical protein MUE67_04030 [Anaerolineales bacterium]|jgi:hypothetical protein|nr:hypothetical protein [Anaerolineales bacterium]
MPKPSDETGQMILTHPGRSFSRRDLWWLLPCLGFIGAGLGLGLYQIEQLRPRYGLLASYFRVEVWFLMAYFFLLILLAGIVYRMSTARRFFSIHENGLRWRIKGFRVHQACFDQISGIAAAETERRFLGKAIQNDFQSVIYFKDGRVVELDGRLENLPELVEAIKGQYYPKIYPNLLQEFKAGRQLQFGPLAVQNGSLQLAKGVSAATFLAEPPRPKGMRSVPFSEIADLAVHSGYLVVKSENSKTKRIPVSQIPNFEILLKLVEQRVNA